MVATKQYTQNRTEDLQALIADNDPLVITALNAAGEQRCWWQNRDDWRRSYTRFTHEANAYCTLLFETTQAPQKLCLVILTRQKPDNHLQGAHFLDPLLGWMCIMPFYRDPVLTSLPGILARYPDSRVVRYRPLKRCTLTARHASRDETVFVKVFADQRGKNIFNDSRLLWNARQQRRLGFDVAEAIDWDAASQAVVLGMVKGESLTRQLFSSQGAGIAKRMGQACGSLPACGLTPALTFNRYTQYLRTQRYASELKQRLPILDRAIDRFLVTVSGYNQSLPKAPLRPIHGAPHAHQWLDSGDRLGLIDFDRFCMGDPELDVATFVAEMDFEDPAQVPIDAINQAFMHQYEQQAGPLNLPLFQLYRAQKRLAKALKAARSVRQGAMDRATRHFHFAAACLQEVKS